MKGFFHKSQLLAMGTKPPNLTPRCERCRLYKDCTSPKMPPVGEGLKGVLIIAEAPGRTEDESGEQLTGKAAQRLRKTLNEIGIDLEEDCVKTNSIICRPPGNRTPTSDELSYCRPHLVETIEKHDPHLIIALGSSALLQLITPYWDKDFGVFERWVGNQIPLQPLNAWICPTWHPQYLERDRNEVRDLWFRKHLEAAFSKTRKPWKEVPDYKAMVELPDEEQVRQVFSEMADYQGMAAIDYETNALKPDDKRTAVPVSFSITWGRGKAERCIAYPLVPANLDITRNFLRSPIPKVAANLKYEERWSITHFNTRVRNWCWDTMQCAHVIDNRPGVTSNDFQAFTQLGLPSYSSHISPMLKSKEKGASTVNQILSEINLKQLLIYNGLDTVSELELAIKQMKRLGRKPPWKD